MIDFRHRSTIENLSNELFYEICRYLSGYQIHHAFENLNSYFQQLIYAPSLSFKLNLYPAPKRNDEFVARWKRVVADHRPQIFSLQSPDFLENDELLLSLPIDSSLHHLQSLVLTDISPSALIIVLPNLSTLSLALVYIISRSEHSTHHQI